MKILMFCRHKSAGWEGVIFQEDDGRIRITNGAAIWDDSEKRRASLEEVKTVELQNICDGLEHYNLHDRLPALLRARMDQDYLARPLVKDLRYEISEQQIDIRCSGTILAQAKGPSPILDQKSLLEQYSSVLKLGKERRVQISFVNHMRRKIRTHWKEYLTAAADRAQTYQKMLDQARVLEQRGIHIGYRYDKMLQEWYRLQVYYEMFYRNGNICHEMEWIARELKDLAWEFADHPEMRGRGHKIYL